MPKPVWMFSATFGAAAEAVALPGWLDNPVRVVVRSGTKLGAGVEGGGEEDGGGEGGGGGGGGGEVEGISPTVEQIGPCRTSECTPHLRGLFIAFHRLSLHFHRLSLPFTAVLQHMTGGAGFSWPAVAGAAGWCWPAGLIQCAMR